MMHASLHDLTVQPYFLCCTLLEEAGGENGSSTSVHNCKLELSFSLSFDSSYYVFVGKKKKVVLMTICYKSVYLFIVHYLVKTQNSNKYQLLID